MGRMLGAFDSDNDSERADLNKCPDCGCYFPQDHCPLCGKECPEEMRAGNRKPVKKKKRRFSGDSGRVTFMAWYHSWWFIILMLFVSPLISIILLATSPHKRSHKILAIVIAVAYWFLSTFGGALIFYLGGFLGGKDVPVDTKLTREEYIAACETVTAEDFYRSSNAYTEKFISLEVVIEKSMIDAYEYGDDYVLYHQYYVCRAVDGGDFFILVRDCIQDNPQNFIPGDVITVYGEGAGTQTVYDSAYTPHTAPCIFMAYVN